MKKRKISVIQISRVLIQILFFIFLPSLFINTFSGIKQIYLAIIRQNISFVQLLPQLIEVIVIIPFTIIMGRFFCGWMCAFGAFGDFIYKLSNKIFHIKFKINENADRVLKYFKYVLLAFLIFVICTFNISAFSTFSPWDVFGIIATAGKVPDFSYAAVNLTAGFILFLLIALSSVFIERFFCRYLCPLGAVFELTSRLKIAKIRKEKTKCGNCRICTNNCAMGIPLYQYDVVNSGECINCMQCIKACPRQNVTLAVKGKDARPLIAGAAAVSIMTGLYYAGSIGVSAAGLNTLPIETGVSQNKTNSLYKDGTYEGSGTGFRGTTTVSVTVKNDKITDITTVSYQDDERFYDAAANIIIQKIIDSQSISVDAVSGATFSSNGIMEAVGNALSKAKISSDSASSDSQQDTNDFNTEAPASDNGNASTQTDASVSDTIDENSQSQAESTYTSHDSSASNSQSGTDASSDETSNNGLRYKDGTYEGSGAGFRGKTTISVVIQNGKITDITTVSTRDDGRFYNRAFSTITEEIVISQTSNVDAVSGATFSSNGIMEAVENALSKAK